MTHGVHQVRRVIPPALLRSMARKRVEQLWENDAYRELQEAQMRFLLEFTDRAPEIPALARRFAEETILKTHLRWHPWKIVRQEVRGIEWLTTKRDASRPTILNFMHHYQYEGCFASVRRAGAALTILTLHSVMGKDQPPGMRQHIGLVAQGGVQIPTLGGTDFIADQLLPGMTMAIASDIPGHTPTTFLGREVLSSFGAARISMMKDAPVVLLTVEREPDGHHYLQLHEPLDPRNYTDPKDLLADILKGHEAAILAWPEVVDMPRARFGHVEGWGT
ncbi:MAG TPA: hypothetical protein VHZ06_06395 [Marmoricola sp.]|nr:hypothetical protein [Marmoricola sp.]